MAVIEFDKSELQRALETVSRGVGKDSSPLPILGNILFRDGYVYGTNLEIGITSYVGNFEGEFLLPSRVVDIVKSFNSNTVKMEFDGDIAVLKGGKSRFKLKSISTENYPDMMYKGNETYATFGKGVIKEVTDHTLFATSKNSSRPAFSGVLFTFEGKDLKAVASDTFRLSIYRRDNVTHDDTGGEGVSTLLMPVDALKEASKIEGDNVELQVMDNVKQACFAGQYTTVATRLLEDNFPNFDSVIPKDDAPIKHTVDREAFIELLGRASLVVDSSNAIWVEFAESNLKIQSKSDMGEVDDSMESDGVGEGGVYLNVKYLIDALKSVSYEKVDINIHGLHSPVCITSENWFYLLLPIKKM